MALDLKTNYMRIPRCDTRYLSVPKWGPHALSVLGEFCTCP